MEEGREGRRAKGDDGGETAQHLFIQRTLRDCLFPEKPICILESRHQYDVRETLGSVAFCLWCLLYRRYSPISLLYCVEWNFIFVIVLAVKFEIVKYIFLVIVQRNHCVKKHFFTAFPPTFPPLLLLVDLFLLLCLLQSHLILLFLFRLLLFLDLFAHFTLLFFKTCRRPLDSGLISEKTDSSLPSNFPLSWTMHTHCVLYFIV